MLTIRREQLEALAAEWERSRRTALAARLRRDFPANCGGVAEQQMRNQIEDGCKAADVLGISDTDHLYRFLRLRYLSPSTWERTGAEEMMVRILTDTSVDVERRLQFVENNIVPKPRTA